MLNFLKKLALKPKQEPNAEPDSLCPNCNKKLEKKPGKKAKCPSCGKFIYVRTSPKTQQKILTTESGAKKIDQEWEKIYSAKRWLGMLKSYGVDEKDLSKYKEKEGGSDRDAIWSIFNELIERYAKKNDLQNLKMVYYQMALFLNEEGKDFFKIRQQSSIMELKQFQKEGFVKKVKILASDESCEACKKLKNKIFTINEALEKLPIPCAECTHIMDNGKRGFCRCLYNSVI